MQKWEVKRYLNSKEVSPWSVQQSRAKANRVLPREHTGLSTAQEMKLHMDIIRWPIPKSN